MSVLPTFHCFQAKQSSQKPPNICTDDLVWEVINKCVMKMDECLKFGFFKIINSLKTKAIVLHVEKLREDLWQDHHRKPMSSFNANSEKSLNLHAWKLTRSQKDFYLVWLTRFNLFAGQPSFFFFYLFLESSMWHPSHCINRVVSFFLRLLILVWIQLRRVLTLIQRTIKKSKSLQHNQRYCLSYSKPASLSNLAPTHNATLPLNVWSEN